MSSSNSSLSIFLLDDQGEFTLAGSSMAPPGHFRAIVTAEMQVNADSTVYHLITANQRRGMKMVFSREEIDALEKEAVVYYKMVPHLQGSLILNVYGFYRGRDEKGREVACIVGEDSRGLLEDEGKLPSLPMARRQANRREALELFGRAHQAGLAPEFDLSGHNIGITANGSLRMVHLNNLQWHDPPCAWDGRWHFGEAPPDPDEFGCQSLYEAGRDLGVWGCLENVVRTVTVDGYTVGNHSSSISTHVEVVVE